MRIPCGHAVAAVVVGGGPPEVGAWNGFKQFPAAIDIGNQSAGEVAEQNAEAVALHPGVEIAADDAQRPANRLCRLFLSLVYALGKGNLVAAGRPGRVLPEAEGQGDGIFSGSRLLLEGQAAGLALHRGYVYAQFRRLHHDAVPRERGNAGKGRGGGEEASVGDHRARGAHAGHDILIVVFDLLHLGAFGSIPVHDAVAGEVEITRPVVKIAAVAIGRLTVAVLVKQALVDKIPYEPALIKRFLIGVFGILVHGAAGIAHCVRIFTHDERLFAVLCQIGADLRNWRIHPADHIAGFRIARVVGNALVMHQTVGVERTQMPAQLIDHLAAEGFIPTAPDQHTGMVFVPLIQGIHPVRQPGQVFHAVSRKGVGDGMLSPHDRFPYAMGFQVGFVNHIQAQLVTQRVEGALVGIMAGAHGVDVVALHGDKVAADGFLRDGTAGFGAEIMPVDLLENDAAAVETHYAILHFKAAEAHALTDHLHHKSLRVVHGQQKIVQAGRFAAPQLRPSDRQLEVRCFAAAPRLSQQGLSVHQRRMQGGILHPPAQHQRCIQHEGRIGTGVIQQRLYADVPQMRLGNANQGNAAEQAGKPEKILILQPAANIPAVHAAGQLVFAVGQVRGQLKFGGGEGIRGKAHVMTVEPYRHAAFRSLKAHQHTLPAHGFRQEKILDIAGDGVIAARNFSEGHVLHAVPGVLHIDVLGRSVALQLNMGGNADIRPASAVIAAALKAGNDLFFVAGVKELPQAVQRLAQAGGATQQLLHAGEGNMVGMRRKPVFRKVSRVLQMPVFKAHDAFSRAGRDAPFLN